MSLTRFKEKLASARKTAGNTGNATAKVVNGWLDDFNTAVTLLSSFGFRVKKFKVGSGVTPQIATSIVGSLERVKKDEIKTLIEKTKDRKIVTAILKAVITAKNIQEHVDVLPTLDVRIDIVLGWPPDISIDFLTDEESRLRQAA